MTTVLGLVVFPLGLVVPAPSCIISAPRVTRRRDIPLIVSAMGSPPDYSLEHALVDAIERAKVMLAAGLW